MHTNMRVCVHIGKRNYNKWLCVLDPTTDMKTLVREPGQDIATTRLDDPKPKHHV